MDVNNYRTADPILHHCFIPHGQGRLYYKEYKSKYFINSYGFRDREYPLKKQADTYRIITLGDSFAEGYGVNIEDNFSEQLENKLNENLPDNRYKNYEVINGGIASYNAILEYLFFKNKCLKFQPDLVILLLDCSDFGDTMHYSSLALFNEEDIPIAVRPTDAQIDDTNIKNNPLSSFISKYSMFYIYVRLKFYKYMIEHKKKDYGAKFRFGDPKIDRFFMLRDKVYVYDNKFEKYNIENNSPQAISKPLDLTFKYLKMIKGLCNKNGIKFFVVIYPFGHQVSETEWNRGRVDYGFTQGKIYDDFPEYENIIKNFAEKYGIEVLSLYQDFRNTQLHSLYYDWDGHWTKNGHRVVAEGIYNYLVSSTIPGTGIISNPDQLIGP